MYDHVPIFSPFQLPPQPVMNTIQRAVIFTACGGILRKVTCQNILQEKPLACAKRYLNLGFNRQQGGNHGEKKFTDYGFTFLALAMVILFGIF